MNAERTIGTSVITKVATLDRVLRAHAAGSGGHFAGPPLRWPSLRVRPA
jgi:hypothetical protein